MRSHSIGEVCTGGCPIRGYPVRGSSYRRLLLLEFTHMYFTLRRMYR